MPDPDDCAQPFKTCSKCRAAWQGPLELVADQSLVVTGYQPDFEDPASGLILLLHNRDGCRTTLAVKAGDLRAFYRDDRPTLLMAGSDDCPRYCLSSEELATCRNPCSMAWVRQVIQHLRQHDPPPHLRAHPDNDSPQAR